MSPNSPTTQEIMSRYTVQATQEGKQGPTHNLQDGHSERAKALKLNASEQLEQFSKKVHHSSTASPTTPLSRAPTLYSATRNNSTATIVDKDHLDQHDNATSPTSSVSPTSSRAPTIHETREDQNNKVAKDDLGQFTEQTTKDIYSNAIGEAKKSIRSICWQGVLAMIAGIFAQMLCWGLIMTYGTILAFYVRYLIPETQETLVVLAGAIPPFCLLALALPWGRLLDAGHHRELNIAAGIFLTSGLTALAFTGKDEYDSGKYWAILLASIPMGIGQSIYFLAAPQMAKTWHPDHKGFAMGITNSGAAIGGVAWPLLFGRLVDTIGFRGGVAVLAGIALVLSIFIAVFAVPAPDFKRRSIGKSSNFRTWWPTRAFRSKVFVVHIISMAFVYLGILTIPFFIEIWARRSRDISVSEDVRIGNGLDIDRSNELGIYLLITLNACQLPGRLFGSTLCDRFSARKIHAAACFIAVIIIGSCWFEVTSFEGGEAFVALFGLTLGVMVSLPINDVQDLLGSDRTHLLGQYAGAVYTCCSPFILAGAVISGALVEFFDVWVAPGTWCMLCFGIGGCGILVGLWMNDDTSCFEDDPTGCETTEHDGSTRCNFIIVDGRSQSLDDKKAGWNCSECPV